MKADMRFLLSLVFLLFLSCTAFALTEADKKTMIELTVVKQDSLISICEKYLFKPEKWSQIAQLNRLKNPDLILPGQKLYFPVQMLKGMVSSGTAEFVKGDVLTRSSKDKNWQWLNTDDKIDAGSALKTGDDSELTVRFSDGTSFSMRENTELSINQSLEGPLHLLRKLSLKSGKVISRIRQATGRASRYEIETPSALAAVRGTSYRVSLDEQNNTRIESLEHDIAISTQTDELLLKEGSGVIIDKDENKIAQPVKLLPPPEPVLLAAVYGDQTNSIFFSLQPDALKYQVTLAKDEEGLYPLKSATIPVDEPFQFGGLADGKYFLFASTINKDGLEGAYSKPYSISIRRKPVPPVLVQNIDHETLPEMPVTLQWHHVIDAASYQIELATSADFDKTLLLTENTGQTKITTTPLVAGEYHLRLRSLAADNYQGDWSPTQAFTVVKQQAPALDMTAQNGRTYLQWAPITDAASYRLQVAADDTFAKLYIDQDVDSTKIMLKDNIPSGHHAIRVAGKDTEGTQGGFSQTGYIDIPEKLLFKLGTFGTIGGLALLMLLLL